MTAFFRFRNFYPSVFILGNVQRGIVGAGRRRAYLMGLALLAGLMGFAHAADNPQQLKNAIDQQQSELDKTRSAQDQIRKSLKKTQQQLVETARAQDALEDQIAAIEIEKSRLEDDANSISTSISQLRPQIAASLKLAYTLGDQATLSSLFSYGDTLVTERNLVYIKVLLSKSLDQMAQLKQAERNQISNQQSLLETQAKLSAAREDLEKTLMQRRAQQAEQNQLLAALGGQADQQSQHLAALLEQKKALDAQIASLNAQAARERAERKAQAKAAAERDRAEQARQTHIDRDSKSNTSPTRSESLEEDEPQSPPVVVNRGSAIPIQGKIIRSFGAPIADGDMQSQGILFAAPMNSPVRAVAPGKVVYADVMKGWGNLVIVRHAGGFLSLYAHNSRLLVQTGTRVNQGTELALSGQIDGRETGLYFEVRHGNDTINPARWAAYRSASR
ncbi:MAG: murein hydrolase activator EnvC family protein [Halothiobacillus sp.]